MFYKSGRPDLSQQVRTPQLSGNSRSSKTYQDNDIFGYKNEKSATSTDQTRVNANQNMPAYRRNGDSMQGLLQMQPLGDQDSRNKLKKAPVQKFEPCDAGETSQKRHIKEFHGELAAKRYDHSPERKKRQPPFSTHEEVPITNAQGRVQYDQTSNIFGTGIRTIKQDEPENTQNIPNQESGITSQDGQNQVKKVNFEQETQSQSEIASSQVHKRLDYYDESSPRKKAVDREFADRRNEDVRKLNHQFSDLFGHEDKNYVYGRTRGQQQNNGGYPGQENPQFQAPPTPLESNAQSPQKQATKIPTGGSPRKQKESYVLERLNQMNRSPLKEREKQYQDYSKHTPTQKKVDDIYRSQTLPWEQSPSHAQFMDKRSSAKKGESQLYDFDLKKIPQNIDYQALKRLFQGHHLVELTTDIDQLNGQPKGTGRARVKAHDEAEIVSLTMKLERNNIQVNEHNTNLNKKNNYVETVGIGWADQNIQKEQRQSVNRDLNAYQCRAKNLQSQGDIFGSSKGVGQWDATGRPQTGKDRYQNTLEDHVQTMNWKKQVSGVPNTKYSEVTPFYHFTQYTGSSASSRPRTPF